MASTIPGYHGVLLEVDLSNRKVNQVDLNPANAANFVGGRGFGMRILWGHLKPGVDALSPENPFMITVGPFQGFPIPYSGRFTTVCKHPQTSPIESKYPKASTISFSSCGGFFGSTLKLAGYDSLIVIGKSEDPAVIVIDDGKVEIRDGRKYWGMMTSACEKQLVQDLGGRFDVCTVGPAAENGCT
ncbi:MAG: aldehyde ferredoxin oxidoreductase N-terminal domain-containing protein, partial [Pseudomonadota bacterium]